MKSKHAWALLLTLIGIAVYGANLSLAPAAIADPPDRQVLTPTDEFFGPGEECPAALEPAGVHVMNTGPTSVLRVWDTGRLLFSGRHPGEFTDLATGKSVDLQLQGSADFVPQPDGSGEGRLSGTTVFEFFPGDVGPGDQTIPRVYVFTGDVKLTFDASGAVVAFNSNGTMADVCAMIA
jgi:hypothetical protein